MTDEKKIDWRQNLKKQRIRLCAKCNEFSMCHYYRTVCLKCNSKYTQEYVKRNREKKRLWNREYFKRHPKYVYKKTVQWRANHKTAYKSYQLVQTAIRNGSLQKQVCVNCDEIKVQAHHENYNKPLDVTWLCHNHHMQHHYMIERSKNP